jgi:hypothetical protein
MGYCGTFAKPIKCTIDTKIDNFSNGGRWSCDFYRRAVRRRFLYLPLR